MIRGGLGKAATFSSEEDGGELLKRVTTDGTDGGRGRKREEKGTGEWESSGLGAVSLSEP